jgi:hypothetical protein
MFSLSWEASLSGIIVTNFPDFTWSNCDEEGGREIREWCEKREEGVSDLNKIAKEDGSAHLLSHVCVIEPVLVISSSLISQGVRKNYIYSRKSMKEDIFDLQSC